MAAPKRLTMWQPLISLGVCVAIMIAGVLTLPLLRGDEVLPPDDELNAADNNQGEDEDGDSRRTRATATATEPRSTDSLQVASTADGAVATTAPRGTDIERTEEIVAMDTHYTLIPAPCVPPLDEQDIPVIRDNTTNLEYVFCELCGMSHYNDCEHRPDYCELVHLCPYCVCKYVAENMPKIASRVIYYSYPYENYEEHFGMGIIEKFVDFINQTTEWIYDIRFHGEPNKDFYIDCNININGKAPWSFPIAIKLFHSNESAQNNEINWKSNQIVYIQTAFFIKENAMFIYMGHNHEIIDVLKQFEAIF